MLSLCASCLLLTPDVSSSTWSSHNVCQSLAFTTANTWMHARKQLWALNIVKICARAEWNKKKCMLLSNITKDTTLKQCMYFIFAGKSVESRDLHPGQHSIVPQTLVKYSQRSRVLFLSSIQVCLQCYIVQRLCLKEWQIVGPKDDGESIREWFRVHDWF